jgi:hypothetical protein
MVDGDMKHFAAIDNLGQQRIDATWSVSDPTLASLQSITSPELTAIAPGQLTLTANVGGVTAQAQITVAPKSLQITPGAATILIGSTRQFTVVDERGRPSGIPTRTVSDSSLASITTGASPILKALAAGQITLSANVEGVTTQSTVIISSVSSFADGTVLWAAPTAPGFTPREFDYAVPTRTGPSIYSVQASSDGTQTLVQALTDDGQGIWQATLRPLAGKSVPDFFGGLVLTETCDPNNPSKTPMVLKINVTTTNLVLTVNLRGFAGVLQDPFSTISERADAVNDVVSVATLQAHPLAGWRYWRVYSVAPNDVVIETGAYDDPGPGLKNFLGYFIGQATISRAWREYMDYLLSRPDLAAVPMGYPVFNLAGQGPVSISKLRDGFWDKAGAYTDYILGNVCQAPRGYLRCN